MRIQSIGAHGRVGMLVIASLALVACQSGSTPGASLSNLPILHQQRVPPPPAPEIKDLGQAGKFKPVVGISDNGVVVGNVTGEPGVQIQTNAVIWDSSGKRTNLPGLNDEVITFAYAVSSTGSVAGYSAESIPGSTHATIWKNQVATGLNVPSVSMSSSALAINDLGDAAGSTSTSQSGQPISWVGGQYAQLPGLSFPGGDAVAINNQRQIIGRTLGYGCGPSAPYCGTVVWDTNSIKNLSQSFAGLIADSISDGGLVVGVRKGNAFALDLGSNNGYEIGQLAGSPHSEARAVNRVGEVVGALNLNEAGLPVDQSRAFMWTLGDATLVDLNTKLPENSGWVLQDAVGINNFEQIVGVGKLKGQDHAYLLSLNTPVQYLSIGDSFASGEGNPPYPGTDQPDNRGQQVNRCHRSFDAWPVKLAESGTMPRPFVTVACSGETAKAMSDTTSGFTYLTEPAQWTRVASSAKVITVMAGGDDIAFGDVAAGCLAAAAVTGKPIGNPAFCEQSSKPGTSRVEKAINDLPGTLDRLYQGIVSRKASSTRVLVVGYPNLLPDLASMKVNGQTITPPMPSGTTCEFLGRDRVIWLRRVEDSLNRKISDAATKYKRYGFEFVPLDRAFILEGSLCTTDGSVNGLDYLTNHQPLLDTSGVFHPNTHGHKEMALAVQGWIHDHPAS